MSKKLLTACMALGALMAFAAAPPAALATNDPDVTFPTGTLLAASHASPAAVTSTNVGNVLMTNSSSSILLTCTTAQIEGELETNTGSVVEATLRSATFGGDGPTAHGEPECTGTFGNVTVTANPATNGLPWCMRSTGSMATDEFQLRGNGCTSVTRPIRFTLDSTTIGECTYEREGVVSGTYRTHSAGGARATISHVEFKRIAGGFICPSAGFLDMSFDLEAPSGEPLYIS